MKISCIIVEDEPLALERARDYVQKMPLLDLVGVFENGADAFAFIQTHQVDLLFLDINLGELSGIQLLESTRINSQVIITTAYHEYALKGYELNVTDYLLKPYTFERFIQAVGKVRIASEKTLIPEKTFIMVKTENRLEKVNLPDVLYIEGMRDYRRIYTLKKKIMTLQTFTEFENTIPHHILYRVHKSYMVSIDKVESIESDEIRIGDVFIPISATYRKEFYQFMGKM